MSSSYKSHESGAGTKSSAWIVVLVVVVLALLVVPVLLVLGFLWSFRASDVSSPSPVVVEELSSTINGPVQPEPATEPGD